MSVVMMLFAALFGLVFHASQVIEAYAGNIIRVWHQYFAIRSIDSIIKNHNINELQRIFDNYASSPASPILGSVLSMITGLNSTQVMMFGLVYIVVLIISLKIVTKKIIKGENGSTSSIFMIVAMSFSAFCTLLGTYSQASLAFSYLIILILTEMLHDYNMAAVNKGFISSRLLTLMLLCYAGLLYYLPLTFLIISLLLIGGLASNIPNYVKRISLILFIIASAYFIYVGFTFYNDFKSYINVFINSFKPEIFIIWSGSAIERLDLIFQVLLWLTRAYPFTLIFILAGLFYAYKTEPSFRLLALLGIIGISGAISGKFVHALTDYTLRLNSLVLLATPLGLHYGAQLVRIISKKIKLRPTFTRVFIPLLFTITLITLISIWFFSALMYPVLPKSASDSHFFIRETFKTSIYVGNMLKYPDNILISANYRYGYLMSIYGINRISDYLTIIDSHANEQTAIIVLSKLSKDLPDFGKPPLSNEQWNKLHEFFNIIYMSSQSIVFMRSR
jgi:hypothetical protein